MNFLRQFLRLAYINGGGILVIISLLLHNTVFASEKISSLEACKGDTCIISDSKTVSNLGGNLDAIYQVDKSYTTFTVNSGVILEVGRSQYNSYLEGVLYIYSNTSNETITTFMNNGTIIAQPGVGNSGDGIKISNTNVTNLINNGSITSGNQSGISLDTAKITTLTNDTNGTIKGNYGLYIADEVTTINNHGTISGDNGSYAINATGVDGYIGTINNSGAITNSIVTANNAKVGIINNSGTITGGIWGDITEINNSGNIYITNNNNKVGDKFINIYSSNTNGLKLGEYRLFITEDSDSFNNFSGYTTSSNDLSHLAIAMQSGDKIVLKNGFSMLLDIGSNFQYDTDYALNKLINIYDLSGNTSNKPMQTESGNTITSNDLFSYLATLSPVLSIEQGSTNDYFKISVKANNGIGNTIYKGNIQSMNNLLIQSYKTIFNPYKNASTNKLNMQKPNTSVSTRATSNIQYSISLRQARGLGANKHLRTRNLATSNDVIEDLVDSRNNDFFFMPFVSHNILNNSDGVGLSGLSYGFISGLNTLLGESNTFGFHLGFNYGNISGSGNVSRNSTYMQADITTLNIMLGLHYKLDLVYDMYIKLMGDVAYFMNDLNYNVGDLANTLKPNTLGYAVSGYFGKDFSINEYGKIGLEIGLNYQALQSPHIEMGLESYNKELIHLIYANAEVNYSKVFDNGLGLEASIGTKALLNNPTSKLYIANYSNPIDFIIGVDRILGVFGAGLSYFVNDNIELGMDYIGLFGDKQMSNSGFVNIRLYW